MSSQAVYFKQNILVEPLFNQWYAWSNLMPPATAAMYIANSHLKIMQSFVSTPEIHIAALSNPQMLGGPYINYDSSKVGEIKALLAATLEAQGHMVEFAEAVKTFETLLNIEADGYSLEALYQRVPELLKGYVELVYDLHNRPSIRFIEGLLYKSKYYNEASQSISLSEIDSDERSFVFSTPRLQDDNRLFIKVPFKHAGLDELFRMKQIAQPYERIRKMLNVTAEEDVMFSSFFTTEEPRQCAGFKGDGVRIRYLGHACILIESRDVSILCDPVISYKDSRGADRYIYADLPETIDYVLITHTHQDHIMFETLLQLRHKIKNLIVPKSSGSDRVDPSLKLLLRTIGFTSVHEIDEMERIEISGGEIMGLPFLGEHADLNIRAKLAYFVRMLGRSIILAADSNNLEPRLYQHIHEVVGDVDVFFIGMECEGAPMSWLYGPLLTKPLARKNDQSRRFDGSDYLKGMAIVDIIKPREVYVYAMGQEPWLTFLTSIQYTDESRPIVESDKLVDECRRRGLTAERLYLKKEIFLAALARASTL
jgi:L-ascorbate metabolism protein UlaG (beta-lactamase superfamily)